MNREPTCPECGSPGPFEDDIVGVLEGFENDRFTFAVRHMYTCKKCGHAFHFVDPPVSPGEALPA